MRKHILLAVWLLLCLFAQATGHARSASITFDEGPHLAAGYTLLRTGDLRLQPVHIHPPLGNVLAALPLLGFSDLPDPRSVPGWEIASLSAVTDAVVWQYPHPQRLAFAGRFPIILMTMLLAAVVYRWARDLGGPWAGLLALTLCAFDPNIVAHGSLVTTDMPVTLWGTAALFLTARLLRRPRRGYWASAGLALGLALASKVSAISLLPVLGLLWLLGPRLPWRRRLLATAGALALAGLVLWAAYGFELRAVAGFPLPLPAATHLEIYRSLQEHYRLGHPSFFLGQNGDQGWRAYFPVAFLLKTPLPTLVLLIASCWLQVSGCRFQVTAGNLKPVTCNLKPILRTWSPMLLFPLVYVVSSLFSSVNIGYRHLLPVLPFLFVLVSRPASRILHLASYPQPTHHAPRTTLHVSRFTLHASRLTLSALLLWLIVGTLRISPNDLAFFNELAGGPAGGYRYLVDSNLDWGQNLWQLRDWMAANGVERVYYAHFSPANPAVYGIQADFLPPDPRALPFAPLDPAPGVYAIGATALQGAYTPDVNTYAWFRTHAPTARLGYALFLYEVPTRTAPAWASVCADPLPALSPQAVRADLGRPALRVLLPDCRQGWAYPTGAGTVVLPPDADPPPGAALEAQARHADGRPAYTVYRVAGDAPTPAQPSAGVTVDGPLEFLGHQLQPTTAHPGETVELWTFWRVVESPRRLLSLMGHLLGADGALVAAADGLALPIEQWQPGDIIVQRHQLLVPPGTPPGPLQVETGAYWLDTMARWPLRLPDGTAADHLSLDTITILP